MTDGAASSAPPPAAPKSRNPIKRVYRWVLGWAEHPSGTWALFGISVAESSFFPIPPDILLIAMALSRPRRWAWFALVCSAGSVLGGAIGYGIGMQFYDTLGDGIIQFYGLEEKYAIIQDLYDRHNVLAVAAAGFTPLPYKVFTITAGLFGINFPLFLLASVVSRAGRFFLVAALIGWIGDRAKVFIEKYFNLLTVLFFLALIAGFVVIKWLVH